MTSLCVPIFVQSLEQAARGTAIAAEAGAGLVEYRIDTFNDESAIAALLASSVLPAIVTCRAEDEGGASPLNDAERLDLLDRILDPHASYIDVELKSLQKGEPPPRETRPGLIVSSHDFTGRPARLTSIVTELYASCADVAKIVWMARSIRDNLEAFEILQHRQKPTIALCMGEAGLISRVLARKFGAFLTFASLRDESATAPGQVTIHDMKRLYRWDVINQQTKVYGVVASPVMHSMSPAIHNAGFEAVGHDGVYLPLLVNPGYESFKAFMESFLAFEPLDLSGLSITLPHKENALRYLKEKNAEIEPLAERIGTVNTMVIERPGSSPSSGTPGKGRGGGLRLRGFNTDYSAILDTIATALNIPPDQLAGKSVAVIGAGGTGRTAVAALADCGCSVFVYNRTREKADALAAEFNGKTGQVVADDLNKLCDPGAPGLDIYINTTSLGMHPNVDQSPFGDHPPKLTDDSLVFDTIYNPIETILLRQAKAAGAKTVGGVEMFVRQAARQFEAWTNKPAPIELFRQVVESRLSA